MKTFQQAIHAGPDRPGENGWRGRHHRAVVCPDTRREYPLVCMFRGWYEYAQAHERRYESLIGDDGFLGPAWEEIGDSLRTLLNGELGRLDGGICDGFILNTMRDNGVDTDQK